MKRKLYAKLFEPSTTPKKRAALARISTGKQPSPVDADAIKRQLQQQRKRSVPEIEGLSQEFLEVLNASDEVTAHFARTGRDAASLVKQAMGGSGEIFANNSGTVQEIADLLLDDGIEVKFNYLAGQSIGENRLDHHWLLPDMTCEAQEDWFTAQKRFTLGASDNGVYYKNNALIGVNSASAEDGTLFLLQHSSNIERLLKARRIVFLVGMEKLVENQEQAKFQTRWAGNFGLRNLILNLEEKRAEAGPKAEKIAGSPGTASPCAPEITVIVLDNGRADLVGTKYESVLHCISCRSCIRQCPTYKFFGKPFGRYPQQYLFFYLIGKIPNIDLCSFCNNCSHECPVGIDVAKMNSLAKGAAHGVLARCKTRLLGNAELLAGSTKMMQPLSEHLFKNDYFKLLLDKTVGIHRNRQLPVYDKVKKKGVEPADKKRKSLIYYAGCWSSFFEHDVFNSTIKFFELLGYDLIIAADNCCGLPLIASGEIEAAKKKADALVPKLLELDSGMDIVTTCPSCSLALKKDYRDLGVDGAAELEGRVFDVLEYILGMEEVVSGRVKFHSGDKKIAYHLPCHQRVQNLDHVALDSLRLIPGITVEDVNRGCCGISGAWGQKKQFYEYSMVTGGEVFQPIHDGDYTTVSTECGTCKLQMEHGTGLEALHPIMLLAEHAFTDEQAALKTVNTSEGLKHDHITAAGEQR